MRTFFILFSAAMAIVSSYAAFHGDYAKATFYYCAIIMAYLLYRDCK